MASDIDRPDTIRPEEGPATKGPNGPMTWCESALVDSRISLAACDLDGRYLWAFNPPGEIDGELRGRFDRDVMPHDTAIVLSQAKQAALDSGEPQSLQIRLGGEHGPRWYDVAIRLHHENGETVGTVISLVDATDSKVQEEHLRIVLRELTHRSKNLLAVIQGIARQTAAGALSTQQFLSRFNGRIFSLSRAHDILTDADWRGARIFDLVRSQMALYAEDRLDSVAIEGENAFLRPNAAQYVGLALHELTTNALKYGALSRTDGKIAVHFDRSDGDGVYRFSWRETSAAEMREPRGTSFGLIMLTEVVPASVSGKAALNFEPDGLDYALDIPSGQLVP